MRSGLYGSGLTIDYADDSETGRHKILNESCDAIIVNITLPDELKLISPILTSLRAIP
jgi:hypothetical protein